MKRIVIAFLLIVVFVTLAGCSTGPDDGIKIPSSAGVYQGQNYQDVVDGLEKAGFTNIELEILEDLVTGWMTKDGEVETVSVDGNKKYNADARYASDVKIIVTYHAFPTDETPTETKSPDAPPKTTEPTDTQTETIYSIENCDDFSAILKKQADIDVSYTEFAERYKGQTIEFDGCIVYLINHNNYDTRYDLLLYAGDYVDEDTKNLGPTFKFEDVNTYNLGINDLTLPAFISTGQNVHITAKVVKFDADTGLFFLKPLSVTER